MVRHLGVAALALALTACTQTPAGSPPSPSPAAPAPARAAAPMATATALLRDLAGGRVGTVTLSDSYAGVIVAGDLTGLGLGAHGIHIHAVGKCDPPFTTAGGHFNPLQKHHGFKNPDGPHLGDLPNIDTPAAGRLHFEFLVPGVTLHGSNALLDADGAAIVVHSARDDYATDPAGDSGSRIACGVITGR